MGVEEGTVILEMTGSPGAALPLGPASKRYPARRSRDGRRRIRGPVPNRHLRSRQRPRKPRARRCSIAEINPVIAAHRGRVSLVEVEQGWVRVRLEGGCQGCSLAEVTLRQGIEPMLRARVPGIVGLADVTDHAAGTTPFYSAEKR